MVVPRKCAHVQSPGTLCPEAPVWEKLPPSTAQTPAEDAAPPAGAGSTFLCAEGVRVCVQKHAWSPQGPRQARRARVVGPAPPSRPQPHEARVGVVQKAPGAPGVSDVRLVRPFPGAQTPRAGGWAAAGPRCPGAPRARQTEQGRLEREPPLPWGAPAPLCASWVLWNSSERK